MEPYVAKTMPFEYEMDKELLRLISEANTKYGEYKAMLNTLEFDASYFLDSVLLTESYKSTQIEGTQISQDEMFYLKYMEKTDDNKEIQNLKKAIGYAECNLSDGISYELVNEMHKILLDSVRGSEKTPGKIRTTQNWIGPRGCTLETATFVPPIPEQVYGLLMNLYEYMNSLFIDPFLINVALSHAQFETIHAYKDGNGRLGRALIPIQLSKFEGTEPILFLSEVFELYRPSYQRYLMSYRFGSITSYLTFFMQCVVEQCNSYIYKLKQITQIYEEDMKRISNIRGESIYKIMPVIMKQVVFTKKEVQDESGVSINVVSNNINKLLEMGIIEKDSTVMKRGFCYRRIYNVFVN